MRLRTFGPLLIAIAIGLAGAFLSASGTQGQNHALLEVESSAVYTLRPDLGRLHVSLSITATRAAEGTAVTDRVEVPIVVYANNLNAISDSGEELDVRVPTVLGGKFTRIDVLFGRALAPGEQIRFELDYDLREIRLPNVFITATDIYTPILAIGNRATVQLDLPEGGRWYSLVLPDACERIRAVAEQRFTCSGSSDVYIAAWVQLIDQQQYRTLAGTVETGGGAQSFQLRYEVGHEAWANSVRDLAVTGLPVLESIIGVPLQTVEQFILIEVEPTDLLGYEGVFYCLEKVACRIGIVSGATDRVVLHELAHLWTTELEKRWLAEGLAEFAAQRAARQLGLPVGPPFSLAEDVQVYLDEWGSSLLSRDATDEEIRKEIAGYREAVRFFEDVEGRVGLDPMRGALAFAGGLDVMDSQIFLDLLEGTSGADLTDLFRERVFPPAFSPVLDQRSKAKAELAELRVATAEKGFELRTDPIDAAIGDWNFSEALDGVDDVYAYMDAYPAALEAKTRVSLWGELGLIGKDPDGDLAEAQDEFEQGNFDHAAELAESAEQAYVTASETARDRVLVGVVGIVLVVVVIVGGSWALRGGRP